MTVETAYMSEVSEVLIEKRKKTRRAAAWLREVTFRTDFAGKSGRTATMTLEREPGEWDVVGYIID